MPVSSHRPILIAGPTASGKSAVSLAIAEAFDGVIINADSMQVYRELSVLTARPGAADLARAPHRLYGEISVREAYSVGRWLDDVAAEVANAVAAGQVPIIVGGTGLYFRALLQGLSPVPEIPKDVRSHWRGEADRHTPGELHCMLQARDPAMADRLTMSDPQRIVRALEVIDGTGHSLLHWQGIAVTPVLHAEDADLFVIQPPREDLYQRCNQRFEHMLANGVLDEVRALHDAGVPAAMPAMRALALPQLIDHIDGRLCLDEAARLAKQQTRRYAKRQMTWLRSNMITWKWIFEQDMEKQTQEIFAFIDR